VIVSNNLNNRPVRPVRPCDAQRKAIAAVVLAVAKRITVQCAHLAARQPGVLVYEAGEGRVKHSPLVLAEKLEGIRAFSDGIVGVDGREKTMGAGKILRRRRGGDRQQGEDGEGAPQLTDPQNRWMRWQASSSSALEVA
jgi:hypothetical protein